MLHFILLLSSIWSPNITCLTMRCLGVYIRGCVCVRVCVCVCARASVCVFYIVVNKRHWVMWSGLRPWLDWIPPSLACSQTRLGPLEHRKKMMSSKLLKRQFGLYWGSSCHCSLAGWSRGHLHASVCLGCPMLSLSLKGDWDFCLKRPTTTVIALANEPYKQERTATAVVLYVPSNYSILFFWFCILSHFITANWSIRWDEKRANLEWNPLSCISDSIHFFLHMSVNQHIILFNSLFLSTDKEVINTTDWKDVIVLTQA